MSNRRVNQSVEVFHTDQYPKLTDEDGDLLEPGWYYRFPGDEECIGAFDTKAEAEEDYYLENADLNESSDEPHFF